MCWSAPAVISCANPCRHSSCRPGPKKFLNVSDCLHARPCVARRRPYPTRTTGYNKRSRGGRTRVPRPPRKFDSCDIRRWRPETAARVSQFHFARKLEQELTVSQVVEARVATPLEFPTSSLWSESQRRC